VSSSGGWWRALMPIFVIMLLVYLGSQALTRQTTTSTAPKLSYAQLIQRVEKQPASIKLATFDPGKRQATATLAGSVA
jgi:hypothetical protein